MSELSALLHILLCNKNHSYDPTDILARDENTCYYYVEEDIAGESQDHQYWKNIAENMTEAMNFSTEEELLKFIESFLAISTELNVLIGENEKRRVFIKGLIRL